MIIFRASSGLNVNVDPARIFFDPETGVSDLQAAVNIDHDQTGRVSRRKGYEKVNDTAFHSLFYGGSDVIGVAGTSLCVLSEDLKEYREIATVTDAKLSAVQVADTIYWVNGHEKGYVRAGTNCPWERTEYYGPPTKRVLVGPPIGTIVEVHHSQLYVAAGRVLYISDQFSMHHFDQMRGIVPWEADILMLKSVIGGLFVGTNRGVWFVAVNSPQDFSIAKVNSSRVVEGTAVKVDLDRVNFAAILNEKVTGLGVIWSAREGIYLGTPDGRAYNLTNKKLFPLEANSGSAAIVNGRYIVNIDE
jgi:ligand-binding sensor domain-containing protein